MMKTRFFRLILLVAVLALAGCNTNAPSPVATQAPQQPTADLGVVRTQAVQTVIAQITADALANPSATPTAIPPTATTVPTATQAAATATPVASLTATRAASSGGGGGYVGPTATSYTDRAQLTNQSIRDGASFPGGYDFDVVWTFKNTGFRDWNTEFYIKYIDGDLVPKQDIYMLSEPVKKNDSTSFRVDFVAPTEPGRYESNWALINDDGTAFFNFFIVINVY